MVKRKLTKTIKVGSVFIGGGNPIVIQTMTNTDTKDVKRTLVQIRRIFREGAELVRVSVPDEESANSLKKITEKSPVPIVADIHFNWKLAILSIESGVSKIRINPGTIGSKSNLKTILKIASERKIPIRIGLNAASLPKEVKGINHVDALFQAAKYWVSFFEDNSFFDIVISAKSSSPLETIKVYELLSESFDYPLHLGLTEAGTVFSGSIRSAASLAILLYKGIGDTIRISLSGNPVYEVRAAKELLKSLGLKEGPIVISCPTCARTRINVEKLARKVEQMVSSFKIPIKIAVMGCEVNGPGEAREADLGLAGTKRGIMIFEKGKTIGVYNKKEATEIFMKKIEELVESKRR